MPHSHAQQIAENEMGIIVMPTLSSGNLSSGGMSVFTKNNKLGVPSSRCKEGWKLVKWGSSADAPGTVRRAWLRMGF